MDRFVVGFAFTQSDKSTSPKVLLVEKNRPEWQKGRLNGIGGKIEGNETPQQAMTREAFEETALTIDWIYRGILKGTNLDGRLFECHLFYSYSNAVFDYRQKEDETLSLYDTESLERLNIVDSLNFLIPFGLSKDRIPFMTLTY